MTPDQLLEKGNWPAAIVASGVSIEQQRALAESIIATNRRTKLVTDIPPTVRGGFCVEIEDIEGLDAFAIKSWRISVDFSGANSYLYFDQLNYRPSDCVHPGNSECECDALREDDDEAECDACSWDSSYCTAHQQYH